MKRSCFTQYAIVKEDTAALLTAKLNKVSYELREYDPEVRFSDSDPLCAYITYIKTEEHPETAAEAAAVEGVSFVCGQCPCFVPVRREEDGEVDKRYKRGDCTFDGNELGRALKNSPACDHLYELIREGGVRICFAE